MKLYQEQELKIYNSLTNEKEVFTPINEGHVGMYVCGPTVYSNVHLGNVRTFMSFDMIFRYLKHLGYKVRYVRNITDVGHLVDDAEEGEDKIAKKARIEQLEPMEIVQKYTLDFHEILQKFNFIPPSVEPTATGHMVEQIAQSMNLHFTSITRGSRARQFQLWLGAAFQQSLCCIQHLGRRYIPGANRRVHILY